MPKNTITEVSGDARYVKEDGSFMSGPLAMSGHEITGLKDPVGPTDATNKQWVEAQIPKGLWGLVAYVRGSPNSHTVKYKSDDVLSVTYRKVTPDTQLIFSFKNDLPDGVYAYNFDVRKNSTLNNGVLIYLLGECGGSGYDCKLTYRFCEAQHNQSLRIAQESRRILFPCQKVKW